MPEFKERRANYAEDIAQAVVMALESHHKLDETQVADLVILRRWIELDTIRRERWEKVRASVIAGAVLAMLGGIGTGSMWIVEYLRTHLK